MHPPDGDAKILDQLAERLGERFGTANQHIIMAGPENSRALCRSRTKPALDAVALGRIARFLGNGEADACTRIRRGDRLQ